MVHEFSKTNSIFNTFLAEMRNVVIQNDSMRFRRNLERVAEIMAYEISKKLHYQKKLITTPLGECEHYDLTEQPVIATILRAGLGMHNGLLNYFDRAENAFVSAYRKHTTAEDFEIYVEYIASPNLDGKTVILSDPMLATGNSMVTVYKALLQYGKPKMIHVAAAIAHTDAINFVKSHLPDTTEYWIGAIDEELTAQSYIVPGIGDAGDLAYGNKI